jgi:acetyltransferase-like isoleucine patch superfamily enzyme
MIMNLLEKVYRSPIGRIMSACAWAAAKLKTPFMVYGFLDPATGAFRKYTRISTSTVILSRKRLSMGDHVWVGHFSILDASEGLAIAEGCQLAAWIGVYTHGSQDAIRLLGPHYAHIPHTHRDGYTRGPVRVGKYTFVGAGSVILPGVTIGKGCLISAGSLVAKDIPDFSIVVGRPGKVVGSTLDTDARLFAEQDCSDTYYEEEALPEIRKRLAAKEPDG